MRLHPRQGPLLAGTHEPAVPRDVRGENGGQPAFDACDGQSGAPSTAWAEWIIGPHPHSTPEGDRLAFPFEEAESPNILLGKDPERQREIDSICRVIERLAVAGIPAATYNLCILG